MECPNCHSPVPANLVHCKHCGSALAGQDDQATGNGEKGELKMSRPERKEEEFELNAVPDDDKWEFSREEGWVPTPRMTGEVPARALEELRWGGFFRRCGAFVIDLLVVIALAGTMIGMAYVGYKVGLAAHGRRPSLDNTLPLIVGLIWAVSLLATGYFVMLHTLSGQTLGKSIFKLRVVGADHETIGYGRALWRWVSTVATAPLLLGLLWILWSAEKRAWHDMMAGTWVMRE